MLHSIPVRWAISDIALGRRQGSSIRKAVVLDVHLGTDQHLHEQRSVHSGCRIGNTHPSMVFCRGRYCQSRAFDLVGSVNGIGWSDSRYGHLLSASISRTTDVEGT